MAFTLRNDDPSIYAMHFTDAAGNLWDVIDYAGYRCARKRIPLGNSRAEGRAFVPVNREGPVMLHHFGYTPYRDADDRTLQWQLDVAKPANAKARDRIGQ